MGKSDFSVSHFPSASSPASQCWQRALRLKPPNLSESVTGSDQCFGGVEGGSLGLWYSIAKEHMNLLSPFIFKNKRPLAESSLGASHCAMHPECSISTNSQDNKHPSWFNLISFCFNVMGWFVHRWAGTADSHGLCVQLRKGGISTEALADFFLTKQGKKNCFLNNLPCLTWSVPKSQDRHRTPRLCSRVERTPPGPLRADLSAQKVLKPRGRGRIH